MYRMLAILGAGAVAAGVLAAAPAAAADRAHARMMDTEGNSLGTVELLRTPAGVLLTGRLEPLTVGTHAIHIHETGACDAADGFSSAGGHFAVGHEHGFMSQGGPHPGDMPNVHVPASGILMLETLNPRVSLDEGNEAYLLEGDGTALVIHAGADDYKSQPSGNAGDRVACGVIEAQ